MSDISKIQTNGNTYDVKDATARENLDGLVSNFTTLQNMVREVQEVADNASGQASSALNVGRAAQETADSAQQSAESAKDTANDAHGLAEEAQNTAESKVSSVNIGTVTTGDSPSVTNSGTDKDVVMDFVFPSGGGLQALTGTVAGGETLKFTGDYVLAILANSSLKMADYWLCAKMTAYGCIDQTGSILISFNGDHYEAYAVDASDMEYYLIGATLVE